MRSSVSCAFTIGVSMLVATLADVFLPNPCSQMNPPTTRTTATTTAASRPTASPDSGAGAGGRTGADAGIPNWLGPAATGIPNWLVTGAAGMAGPVGGGVVGAPKKSKSPDVTLD